MAGTERRRQQPVARHRIEDARLRQHHDQDDRGQAGERAEDHRDRQPLQLGMRLQCSGDRCCVIQLRIFEHAREHAGHQHVQDRADDETGENAERHVALRILRFLRRRGDRVEADVGEEDDAGGADDAAPAELAPHARVLRNERLPVVGGDVERTEADHQHHDADLDRDHDRVRQRRLADAEHEDDGDYGDDEYRRQVEHRAGGEETLLERVVDRRATERWWDEVDPQGVEELDQVARPADGNSGGREQIFEHQVPADEPRHAFAERRVRVRVGAAGDGNHGGELGVAQPGEDAADAGDNERQHNCRSGVLGGGEAGEHEDAGADDAADADRGQRHRS